MSGFWAGWVIVLIVLNLGIALFLFLWAPRVKVPVQDDGTTGHVWAHGVLREGLRKLPVWWILFSAALFVFAIVYLVLYPGFGGHKGSRGWTSQGEHARDVAAGNALLQPLIERSRPLSLEQLATDPEALRVGHRLYLDNCAACHGYEARGNQVIGAPDLTDGDWLYGGANDDILKSILEGRSGVMPPWGAALGHQGVNEVAAYVLSFSQVTSPEGWADAGKARFEAVCVACHGPDGRGNRSLGVPDLTDNIWLYGQDFAAVTASVRNGRNGVMPAWRERLGEDRARLVAAWVIAQGTKSAPVVGAK